MFLIKVLMKTKHKHQHLQQPPDQNNLLICYLATTHLLKDGTLTFFLIRAGLKMTVLIS